MASPITWQNVQGRSLAEAAAPMQAASQSILGGFDRLSKVFDQYQGMEQKKLDLADEVNIQGFLDRLQRAGSPEEVAALQASGELERYTSAINNPANLAKLRGAGDARINSLMQQITARNTFNDNQLEREAAPIREAYRLAVLNKDEPTQKAIRDANPGMRGWDKLIEQEQTTERNFIKQGREDELAPLTHKNAITAAEEAQLAQAEKETARRLEAKLAEGLAARTAAETPELGAFPKKVGFSAPQTGTALPAPTSAADAEALHESIMRGGTGLLEGPRTSDTATADAFVQRLRKSGDFSPEFIEKNLERIRSSFDSTGRAGRVGNDAVARATDQAMERVMFDERMKDNWSAPGSSDTKNSYDALAKELPSLIDKSSGTSIDEDIPFLQERLNELANKGIEISPGKFVTPSVNEVKQALRTAPGGDWYLLQGDKYRANRFMERLEKTMKSTDVKKRLEEAEQLKQTARKYAVQDLLNSKK